ncbi:MAG: DUF167 domain-containing protein [Ktedonobacteraceae bacterium]|nr:DUF167 domain-containing protein [Ktedonobacteraceae bacterium]
MRINVRVIPRSSRNTLEWDERERGERGEQASIKARLTAPPVEGAANEALIALLAERLAVPRRAISIVRGATGRQKVVEIEGVTREQLAERLSRQM